MGALGVYVALIFALAWRYAVLPDAPIPARCEVRDGWLYRGGEKFLVKGVGYDPARPGELPWARERSHTLLDDDFAAIRAAGFNTLRTWEPLTLAELDAAQQHELAVIQGVWIDPEGAFADPAFRKASVDRVAEIASGVRGHPAIIAWLVMNEPRPETVLAQGIAPTRQLLRELGDAVRENDPGVPVGFASWPGLELLDEPSLDFVAANLYPFRPSVLVGRVGYAGMVQLWKHEIARDRPLLVTEFGVSVAPGTIAPDAPGGATEAQQAEQLPRYADDIARAGAAGSAVFMWIDGWWKNNDAQGDEQTHDPDDGEEWFGLRAMDQLSDGAGRARPALDTIASHNRVVLTLPADGPVAAREIEIEANVEDPGSYTVEAALNGGEAFVVPAVREGAWLRARMGLLADAKGPQRLTLHVRGPGGDTRFERVLIPPGEGPAIELTLDGDTLVARVRGGDGAAVAGAAVELAAVEPTRRHDQGATVLTDASGEARLPITRPKDEVLLATAAVRSGDDPPLALDTLLIGVGGR